MFKKGDALCFENTPTGNFLDLFGLGIEIFQKLDDFYTDESGLPIDPDKITHIGFVINDTEFVESALSGVRIMPLSKLKGKKYWHCSLREDLRERILLQPQAFDMFVYGEVGKRYDFAQIYKYALSIGSFGLWKPKDDGRYNVCSELYHRALRRVGIRGKESNSSIVTPSDIFAEDWYSERRKKYA